MEDWNRQDHFALQQDIERQRDRAERRRTLLAVLVVCVGAGVAAFALWQNQTTRVVYVPVPMAGAETVPSSAPAVQSQDLWAEATPGGRFAAPPLPPAPVPRQVITAPAPALPLTWTPTPFPMPTPVDYAARDRQVADLKRRIEEIDETIRRVRADPHYYGLIKNSTDTSRQQASDAYLAELDRQRNDLRRQKWALEGR